MELLHSLQQLFKRFPGIGERQAMRFAYFLATSDERYIKELIDTVTSVRKNVRRCSECFALSEKIEGGKCPICNNPKIDRATLLVVEKDADRERFIASRSYSGRYFVLGGLAPAIEKEVASHIRIFELSNLVKNEGTLSEIILGLSATPDGERTEALIISLLSEKIATNGIKISILGKGLSTGTEIEYSDKDTLLNALKSRTNK
ncbi:MAG: recombination protein RecR [Candidatus Pacebacteria bacterium]|nr:recombination protein RecR [Candidatus Paceibacterota bacterium]